MAASTFVYSQDGDAAVKTDTHTHANVHTYTHTRIDTPLTRGQKGNNSNLTRVAYLQL